MSNYKADIYDLLNTTERIAVDQFCQNINNSNVDVYIVMSHKAVQLFNVLLDQNHISKELSNKIIISNQALDFDQSYLLGKRIAIIDDIIISGTTISSTINQLIRIGVFPDSIIVIALAIDKYYFAMDFRKSDGNSILYCNTQLDDPTCIELSYSISKAFSYYGLPYDVDFPEYKAFEAPDNDLSFLYNNLLWETEIISNEMHRKGKIDAFVLFPNQNFKKGFWKSIGIDLLDKVHIKLRVYVINYKSGKKECRVIPMCLFNEISEDDLDELFSLFQPVVPLHIKNCTNEYYVSILRYLQFYLSHHLFTFFCSTIELELKNLPEQKSLAFLFGETDGHIIENTFSQTQPSILDTPTSINRNNPSIDRECHSEFIDSSDCLEATTNYEESKQRNDFYLNKMILSPFLWWYDNKEIPVRIELKNSPKHYINDSEEIIGLTKRLISGYSLNELNELFYDRIKDYDTIKLLSLYLDRAIDEGIIVPTVYHNEKKRYLSRVYRHGEDLPFGIEDECRLLLFLHKLCKRIPKLDYETGFISHGISEISFEKIIVMFYQMGLRKGNIFNRFLGFDNTNLIKPFLSLHGAVRGFISPKDIEKSHFYSEKDKNGQTYITWLSKWLITNNFISKIKYDKNEYRILVNLTEIEIYLTNNERGCISSNLDSEIDNIANMISEWYKTMINTNQRKKFRDDATALTSCNDIYVFASAIATEIHYFSRFWKEQVEKNLPRFRAANSFLSLLTEDDDDKKQTQNIVQGLNSGREKVNWYNSDKANEVVNSVGTILADKGANAWNEIWSSVEVSRKPEYHTVPMNIEDVTQQAIGYLYFFSACYECIISDDFWRKNELPKIINEYKKDYNENCSNNPHLKTNLFSSFDDLAKAKLFTQKKETINSLLNDVINRSEDIVNSIEELVEAHDVNYTIMYKSSLVVDIKAFEKNSIKDSLMCIWNELDSETKSQINFVVLNESNNDYVRCGVFYGYSSNTQIDVSDSCEKLFDIYIKICNAYNAKTYAINAILIPDTIPGHMFRHNIYKNIQMNFSDFIKKNVTGLEQYYDTSSNHQLILAKTKEVSNKVDENVLQYEWDDYKKIDDSCFEELIVFYNKPKEPSVIKGKDISYSVVRITTEEGDGTGLLFRAADCILCVSCNHLLAPDSNKPIYAKHENNPKSIFEIKPLREITPCDYSNGDILSAEDELVLFLPQWKGKIPFKIESIASFEDLLSIGNFVSHEKCICCGFPDDGPQKWSDSFDLIYPTTNGYYQIRIPDSENPVCSGYSGGVIVSEHNNQIIGIHEGRYGTDESSGLIIPCDVILKKINEIKKDMEW